MSNGLLIFILLLIPLSGFIAWCGDLIGHRIGKRRHTLWNLRPRHTATLFTVGAGMCISLVSFALMWMASETFRIVLQEGATLLQTNQSLRGENRDLQNRNQRAERTAQENRIEIERLNGEAKDALAQANRAQDAKRRAFANLRESARLYTKAQTELSRAQGELNREQQRLSATENRLTTTRSELRGKEQRVQTMQQNLNSVRARYTAAQQDVARAQKSLTAARQAEASAQNKLTVAENGARAAMAYQKEKLATLNQQIQEQDTRLAQQEGQAERRRIELSRLNAELKTRRAELEGLFGRSLVATTNLRQGKIIYQAGEEVARVAIDSVTSPFRTRMALEKLLVTSGENAEARGAEKSGMARAAILPTRPVRIDDSDDEPRNLDEAGLLQAALNAILKSNEPVVVVAVAAANTVKGEPVLLELKTFRNPLVLASGVKVAEMQIDGNEDRQQVLNKLYTFLRNDVREKLLLSGVIPPQMRQDDSLVTLNGAEWLQLVADVRDAGAGAIIVVRAAKDLRAADPVALTFDVRPREPFGTRIGKKN